MLLMIDNYDSFTFNLVQYLGELGQSVKVVRNDALDVAGIRALKPSHIMISPGPGTPDDSGVSLDVLRELAGEIRTPLMFAHIRASTGTPVQRSNCHPFRHDRWLWMHNGAIREFHNTKRDLMMAVDPSLFLDIEGSTDSETLFYLALTLDLMQDPFGAVARAIGLVEKVGREHGVEYPFQGTIATSNGESVWAFRYSSEGKSRSLFFSTNVETLRQLHPEVEILQSVGEETRLVVSEPLGDLPGAWNEVPESSAGVVRPGTDEMHSFQPIAP